MIRLTQTDTEVLPGAMDDLRAEFQSTGTAFLPGFLSAGLLIPFQNQVGASQLAAKNEVRNGGAGAIFGTTLRMPDTEPAILSLHFIMNRSRLFELIAQIIGGPALANFTGRVHRTRAGCGEHIGWHDDAVDHRKVAMSIGLNDANYSGGLLQVRDPERCIRKEIGYLAAGDAILFRIGDRWQHQLTPVESGERTVAVGWFRSTPDWQTAFMTGLSTGTIDLNSPV
jgi:hypothetical protein